MCRAIRWALVMFAGLPPLAAASCLPDNVFRRVLADDIVAVIVGAIDTTVSTLFDRFFGAA